MPLYRDFESIGTIELQLHRRCEWQDFNFCMFGRYFYSRKECEGHYLTFLDATRKYLSDRMLHSFCSTGKFYLFYSHPDTQIIFCLRYNRD